MAKKPPLDVRALQAMGQGAAMQDESPKPPETPPIKKNRGGRPPKENKATQNFNMYFTKEDYEILKMNAENQGLSVAVYVKNLIRQAGGFDEQ